MVVVVTPVLVVQVAKQDMRLRKREKERENGPTVTGRNGMERGVLLVRGKRT